MIPMGPFQLETFCDFSLVFPFAISFGLQVPLRDGGSECGSPTLLGLFMECFGLEGTLNGHLVQLPTPLPRCDVSNTSSPTPSRPTLWLGSVSTRIKASETMYLRVLADV